jgi:hypothetical protein
MVVLVLDDEEERTSTIELGLRCYGSVSFALSSILLARGNRAGTQLREQRKRRRCFYGTIDSQ